MRALQRFILFTGLILCLIGPWQAGVQAASSPHNKTIRLATTTSTENSGLLHALLPRFQADTGYEVHVISAGTGKALRMGQDGDVDVVLVHAPAAENKFIAAGYGERRYPVMYNDFVILGPATDPANIAKAASAADALARIAKRSAVFVSRGDDSGTHKKERGLWHTAKLKPVGSWYREAGQGMGKVIQMADELQAYTLADRGTWIAYSNKTQLKIVFQGDSVLHNPYGIIAVNPKRFPEVNHAGALALIKWMTSETGQKRIADFRIAGFTLFTPSAHQLSELGIGK